MTREIARERMLEDGDELGLPPQTAPVCCRCAKPLPENWVWTLDAEGQRDGKQACQSCARDGETGP